MGRNNIENRTLDKNWGYNETQNSHFKFQILNEESCRRFELAQGLEMNKLTLTIRLNAQYKMDIKDKLIIKGRTYKVVTKSNYIENDNQGRLKGRIDDFTGHQVVGLE